MKRIIIYGEFLDQSTTGIAYVNDLLKEVFLTLNHRVLTLVEPRTKDYKKNKELVRKRFYIKDFFKLIFNILKIDKYDLAFITLSQGNNGIFKTSLLDIFKTIFSPTSFEMPSKEIGINANSKFLGIIPAPIP